MYQAEYKRKLTTPESAVADVADSSTLIHGMAAGEPPALLEALAARLRAGDLTDLQVYSLLPMAHMGRTLLDPALADRVHAYTWFVSSSDREMIKRGLSFFIPNEFHQVPRFIRDCMDVDVVITTVSPMDRAGFFTFGAINDYISTAARCAEKLIVEVNPRMPRVFGDSLLHVSEVDAIVENECPLPELTFEPPRPEAEIIGRAITELIPDGATIQLGIGGIPNEVAARLANHTDLGVHTELFCPGMVQLIKQGVITGRRKSIHPRKHVFGNALGDKELYEFIDDNPSMESYPISYVNDPAVIAGNHKMVSINSTLEVDLLGQCNSEYLEGSEFSGTGGQLDYVRGAYRAEGGMSFIAFYATAEDGKFSRIVPRLDPGAVITTPRMDTHYLATEHGIVDLKGKSTKDRALGIIELAHPDFRDDLLRAAQDMKLV
jgi:itaconate CoA-transferase